MVKTGLGRCGGVEVFYDPAKGGHGGGQGETGLETHCILEERPGAWGGVAKQPPTYRQVSGRTPPLRAYIENDVYVGVNIGGHFLVGIV